MKTNKLLKCALALTLTTSLLSGCSIKKEETKSDPLVTTKQTVETNESTGTTLTKDETVYVLCNGDGGVSKVIVSDWIKNGTESTKIEDESNLSNIEVTKGDSTYTMDGNKTVWDAKKGDVYYQGESTDLSSLPVGLSVSYKLDGKSVSLDELDGKSGHLEININYHNYAKQTVKVNGKDTQMYVPFIMVTGMLLDDTFSNVQVSNGKLVELSGKNAVMGFALPGLQEDLGDIGSKLDIPSTVTISADVEKVNMPSMMTMASNSLLDDVDLDEVDSLDELKSQFNELDQGFKQLMDGSSTLYNGMETLLTSANTLVDAIGQVASGVAQLKQGSNDLYDGSISLRDNLETLVAGATSLQTGANTLNTGLATLSSNSQSLRDGAKQVFESLVANVQDSLTENAASLQALGMSSIPTLTTDNFETVLTQIINQLDEGNIVKVVENQVMKQVEAAVEANMPQIEAGVKEAVKAQVTTQVTEAVRTQVRSAVLQQANYTEEVYEANEQVKTAIDTQVEALLPNYSDVINQQVEAKMESAEVKAIIEQNIQQQKQGLISSNYETQLNAYLESDQAKSTLKKANDTAIKLTKAKASIVSYRDQFYAGLVQYTNGVDQAAVGSKSLYEGTVTLTAGATKLHEGSIQLAAGVAQLQAGLNQLDEGVVELNSKVQALPDGVKQLKDGTMQLSDGIQEIYDRGISKLVDLANTDLDSTVERLQTIKDLSTSYNNFSGLSDDMSGSVKFIFKS